MSDLDDLYQEVLLHHGRSPRNFGTLPDGARSAEGFNPLCGDRFHVFVETEGDAVKEIRFHGKGCAISTASGSLMTEAVKGKTRAEVETLFGRFQEMVTGKEPAGNLGKLLAMSGVCKYPTRVKCATLVWHTLRAALDARRDTVTTE